MGNAENRGHLMKTSSQSLLACFLLLSCLSPPPRTQVPLAGAVPPSQQTSETNPDRASTDSARPEGTQIALLVPEAEEERRLLGSTFVVGRWIRRPSVESIPISVQETLQRTVPMDVDSDEDPDVEEENTEDNPLYFAHSGTLCQRNRLNFWLNNRTLGTLGCVYERLFETLPPNPGQPPEIQATLKLQINVNLNDDAATLPFHGLRWLQVVHTNFVNDYANFGEKVLFLDPDDVCRHFYDRARSIPLETLKYTEKQEIREIYDQVCKSFCQGLAKKTGTLVSLQRKACEGYFKRNPIALTSPATEPVDSDKYCIVPFYNAESIAEQPIKAFKDNIQRRLICPKERNTQDGKCPVQGRAKFFWDSTLGFYGVNQYPKSVVMTQLRTINYGFEIYHNPKRTGNGFDRDKAFREYGPYSITSNGQWRNQMYRFRKAIRDFESTWKGLLCYELKKRNH